MAALSVESASVGKATRSPRRAASAVKRCAEFAVGGHSAGDENARGAQRFGRGEGLLHQVADHRVLKAGDEVEGGLRAEGESFFRGLRRAERRPARGPRALWLRRAGRAAPRSAARRS